MPGRKGGKVKPMRPVKRPTRKMTVKKPKKMSY